MRNVGGYSICALAVHGTRFSLAPYHRSGVRGHLDTRNLHSSYMEPILPSLTRINDLAACPPEKGFFDHYRRRSTLYWKCRCRPIGRGALTVSLVMSYLSSEPLGYLFALRSTEKPKFQYISSMAQHNVFPGLCLRTQMRFLEPIVESSSSTVGRWSTPSTLSPPPEEFFLFRDFHISRRQYYLGPFPISRTVQESEAGGFGGGSAEVPRYQAKLLRLAAVLTSPSRAACSAKARVAASIGVTHRAQRRSEATGALFASSEEWEDAE
ncbi:hypothetical protein ACO22_07192 [Paracoccidioides brasiliensis]|uniref:Uncharacterized protein n=1 Tax=Paracoccidioides brasiliensis TaxID=121759 RepID=A0A1D2J5E1_PARBR|nr:hypothetical protein ACO22_07192 [Paracoccidioides brasiliensis]